MMPKVFSDRLLVGELKRGHQAPNAFTYSTEATPSQCVSLLMPTTVAQHLSAPGRLHPAFDQSLPEGALRNALSTLYAKALPVFDDFTLLEIVGRSQIGRLRFASSAEQLDEVPAKNLRDLLSYRGTQDIFADLLQHYARHSGVAGVQPKLLVKDNGSLQNTTLSPIRVGERLTVPGTTHIMKTFDPEQRPGMAVNEFICMKAAAASGLKIPSIELSTNGRFLIISRFDLKPDGTYLAFEDGCSIAGRVSADKYEGSYEQLVKTFLSVLRGPRGNRAEMADLFKSICVSVAVRNGDAHRKNFGVLYDNPFESVILSPTFDLISTTPYIRGDSMALTLDGTKNWPDAKRLGRFGILRCGLDPQQTQTIMEEVRAGVMASLDLIEGLKTVDPGAIVLLDHMRMIWEQGVGSLGVQKRVHFPTIHQERLVKNEPVNESLNEEL